MTNKLLKLSMLALLVLVSCSKDESTIDNQEQNLNQEPLTGKQINQKIDQSLKNTGRFYWKDASVHMLWSAVVQGENMVAIGFGASNNDFEKANSPKSDLMQQQIINLIVEKEGKSVEEIVVYKDEFLNLIDVKISKQETILALRKAANIRYVEPADYKYFAQQETFRGGSDNSIQSDSGCGYESSTLSNSDYSTVTPNAKAPWNFYNHGITNAWSYSSGSGVTIGIIDTGLSPGQSLLNGSFNNGLSTGRTVQKYGTYVDSIWPWSTSTDGPNDQCGHGSSMASAATAPRNNSGMPVGVAYNANLVMYRAASNVVLDGYHEQKGVQNAFTALGNRSDVKIISMSMGHIFSVGRIEDGVRYAYGKGKLIFCAGGTSTSFTTFVGVIFPAWMSETVAVTGIKEASTYQKCDVCHTGSEIDFTIMMQRSSDKTIPVLSYYNGQSNYVGGSSVATATTAGIAALVWSKNPSWSRSQVLLKLKQASHLYPNKHSEFGYGMLNALNAVQ